MDALMESLKLLGVTGQIATEQHDRWTIDVYVNDEWFGLWDTAKNTFVE